MSLKAFSTTQESARHSSATLLARRSFRYSFQGQTGCPGSGPGPMCSLCFAPFSSDDFPRQVAGVPFTLIGHLLTRQQHLFAAFLHIAGPCLAAWAPVAAVSPPKTLSSLLHFLGPMELSVHFGGCWPLSTWLFCGMQKLACVCPLNWRHFYKLTFPST